MKFIKVFAISTLVSASFAAEVAPSVGIAQANAFRGNWTETFQLISPIGVITHTPTYMRIENNSGITQIGRELNVAAGASLDGYTLSAALILRTDSTRDEFVQALQRARIYSGNYNSAQPPVAAKTQKAAAKQAVAAKKAEVKVAKNNAALAKKRAASTKQLARAKKAEVKAAKIEAAIAKKRAAIAKKAEGKAAKKQATAAKKDAAAVKKAAAVAKKEAAKQAAEAKKQEEVARKAVRI